MIVTFLNLQTTNGDSEDNANKKKASYAGGLVLEPKRGFYILLWLI